MGTYCITISRQYGSGGRTIGEMLAKRLGIGYYDKNIIRRASEASGIAEELFGRVDEYQGKTNPFARPVTYTGELFGPRDREFFSEENLFNYQAKAILDLCHSRNCVIIGRCANYILKDEPGVLRVFIHADWDFRMEKAAEKLALSRRELERYLKKDDKRKMDFVKHFTGKDWTDATQYDLCLDSGKLGYEGCIDAILAHLPKV